MSVVSQQHRTAGNSDDVRLLNVLIGLATTHDLFIGLR